MSRAPLNHCLRLASLSADFSGSNAGSIFGDGLYFGDHAGKADQYTTVDKAFDQSNPLHKELYSSSCSHPNDENGGVFYALVCRVALGFPVRTQSSGKEAKSMDGGHSVFLANGRELSHIPDVQPPMFHHSLVAELGKAITMHREIVVFNREQVCPRYLIAYQRLAPGKNPPPQWEGVRGRRDSQARRDSQGSSTSSVATSNY